MVVRSSPNDSLTVTGVSDRKDSHRGRKDQKDQKARAEQQLGNQHRLRLLARAALDLRELAVPHRLGPRTERLTHLRSVVRDKRQRGGKILQLLDAQLLAQLSERFPLAGPGDAGVGEAGADPPQ